MQHDQNDYNQATNMNLKRNIHGNMLIDNHSISHLKEKDVKMADDEKSSDAKLSNNLDHNICLDYTNSQVDSDNSNRLSVVSRTRAKTSKRQRKTGVYNCKFADNTEEDVSDVGNEDDVIKFPCVERLIEMYANIIKQKEAEMQTFMMSVGRNDKEPRLDKKCVDNNNERRSMNRSPVSDEGWSTQQSPYCSSDEDEVKMKNRDKVTRSSSSDSALGLDEDLLNQEQRLNTKRRMTLNVGDIPLRSALLPVPEPTMLQTGDGNTTLSENCPTLVRSRMILEAQLIELPASELPAEPFGCFGDTVSRRESAQSFISDSGDGIRYVRTPSVVVSDYSDEIVCGITLEEIEYFRRHRLRRSSADCDSDVSANSSCSNLNYCGSTISALDGCDYQYGLRTPERKVSDCSTCSTVSCEDEYTFPINIHPHQQQSFPAQRPKKKVSSEKLHDFFA